MSLFYLKKFKFLSFISNRIQIFFSLRTIPIFRSRHGLESNILRYIAYMVTDSPVDKDRKFIISYYLSDDTISLFEPPLRNSGRNQMLSFSCFFVLFFYKI